MLPDFKSFEAVAGQKVELEADGMRLQARIAEVEASRKQHDEERQPFSVLFISDQEQAMPQHVFTLHHEQLGPADLFLIPVGPQDGGMAYEAIFT